MRPRNIFSPPFFGIRPIKRKFLDPVVRLNRGRFSCMDILQNLSTQIKFDAGFDVGAWWLYLAAQVAQLIGQEVFL